MDLQLYGRVLWRSRILVAIGLTLAFLLALLSFTKVSVDDNGLPTLTYREPEQWVSYATVFVTEKGFPWGQLSSAGGDPARLTSLAIIYSQLALSDDVRNIMLRQGPLEGSIEAATVTGSGDDALPLVRIAALAPSAAKAKKLAARETTALRRYIANQQRTNGIRPGNRVALEVVSRPSSGALYTSRGKTRPVVVFLAVLIAFCALAFILENFRINRPEILGSTAGGAHSPAGEGGAAVVTRATPASLRAKEDLKPIGETLHVKADIVGRTDVADTGGATSARA
jgi:hypothetical protein